MSYVLRELDVSTAMSWLRNESVSKMSSSCTAEKDESESSSALQDTKSNLLGLG